MLEIVTMSERLKWDSIVSSFADYDVYWKSGYVNAFKIHGDGEPLMFHYEDEACRGINVVIKKDISKDSRFFGKIAENTVFDFSTPYGYGGWLIEGENTEKLFAEYEKWCKNHNIVSEFVRFHPVLDNCVFSRGAYDVVSLGHTVAMDLSSKETIWNNISSKNRNMIRKAEKCGVKIKMGRTEELYKEFMSIYNKTMEGNGADDYYFFKKEFYDSLYSDLPENAQIFYAEMDDEIIAGSIMLFENGRLNYHLSGSKFEFRKFAPTNLLLYVAAVWGCENGCKTFHLGGGVGSKDDDLFKFKRAFYRGDLYRFSIGRKIFIQEEYDRLLAISNKKSEGFFPEYRG